jgi:hypothetical protein
VERVGQVQLPLIAEDLGEGVEGAPEAAGQHQAAGPGGDDRGRVGLDLAAGRHDGRPDDDLSRVRAEQLVAEPDRVAAHVGQGAAAQRGRQPDVAGLGQPEVEGADDLGQVADGAVGQQADQAPVLGLEREDESLPQQRARHGVRRSEHLGGLGGPDAQRLLAQHGLAGLQRPDRPLGVQ